MFRARTFTFAGIPSAMYGLYCCDIGSAKHSDNRFGNVANIQEQRISGRIRPLHYGVNYNEDPLEFTLIFGRDDPIDRYDMQMIARWLTGYQHYQWLTIDQPDMEDVLFRCLIRELTPISVGWFQYALEARVICDCAYGYSYPFVQEYAVNGVEQVLLRNYSTARELLRPKMMIQVDTSCDSFSVVNQSNNNRETMFSGLPANKPMTFQIDNENGIIQETTGSIPNPYRYFNLHFFEMVDGDNYLTITGKGVVAFTGRYLYNVGA